MPIEKRASEPCCLWAVPGRQRSSERVQKIWWQPPRIRNGRLTWCSFKPNCHINYAVNNFGADHQSSEHDPALMAPDDDQNWIWPNMLASFEKCDAYGVLDENKAKFAYETRNIIP